MVLLRTDLTPRKALYIYLLQTQQKEKVKNYKNKVQNLNFRCG